MVATHKELRFFGREALLALLVLALFFVNFNTSNRAVAADSPITLATAAFCGDAGNTHHFACHACRPDIAVLPERSAGVEAIRFASTPVFYAAYEFPAGGMPPMVGPGARGPPVTI